jgi:hypothetical protein
MLLLCEKRSRVQPPDLSKKRVRIERPEGANDDGDDSSSYSSSEEESSSDEEDGKDGVKDPTRGRVDENKIPPIWDGVTARVLSEFEKMTLAIAPMDDDQCWEDALSQKEENKAVAEAASRGKRAKPESDSPPESPPPPNGAAPRSRKSARIIAKVNRGATYTSYKHLMSGRGTGITGGRGKRMSLTGGGRGGNLTGGVSAMSTLNPEAPLDENATIVFKRDPKTMSLLAADRPGLHQLPPEVNGADIVFPGAGGGEGGVKSAEGGADEIAREGEMTTRLYARFFRCDTQQRARGASRAYHATKRVYHFTQRL